jgi:hypothetical protein
LFEPLCSVQKIHFCLLKQFFNVKLLQWCYKFQYLFSSALCNHWECKKPGCFIGLAITDEDKRICKFCTWAMAASPKRTRRSVPRTSAPNCLIKVGQLTFILGSKISKASSLERFLVPCWFLDWVAPETIYLFINYYYLIYKRHFVSSCSSTVVEQSNSCPKIKGLNPAAAGTGEKCSRVIEFLAFHFSLNLSLVQWLFMKLKLLKSKNVNYWTKFFFSKWVSMSVF